MRWMVKMTLCYHFDDLVTFIAGYIKPLRMKTVMQASCINMKQVFFFFKCLTTISGAFCREV